ncbi:MAG TPA: hypothetical protein P5125_04485 [Kiritimatiellia bacterium]|nr:hypothetical protein [Kiritimatiellia bacterium]HOM58278.1 hypothetical protein [Kiritimatiellia bacterium]HOR97170.1 hypothetical protein [Kiritimatiellia bacterium]HPC49309.1 hypothetical protein [Kiritimatiellia bacterium]HPK36688.1 hypothetical protein [Kiritimatiellia bacterium]
MSGGTSHPDAGKRCGAVLMETVLAIPLFMIFLGGVMWVGDLLVTRQQLVIADRFVAWNHGLRYPDKEKTDPGTIHRYFFTEANGAPSPYHQPSSSDARIDETFDWSHAASGQVRLQMRMPQWVRSMFNAGQVFYDSGVPLEQASNLFGRDKEDQRHVVVMRTRREAQADYIRNRYGRDKSAEVAEQWEAISDEAWPYE